MIFAVDSADLRDRLQLESGSRPSFGWYRLILRPNRTTDCDTSENGLRMPIESHGSSVR